MRSVAIIAFFCLIASALSFNITAYHVGFADQLRLNPQQIRNAATCQNSVKRTINNVVNLFTGRIRNLDSFIFTALDVYNGAKRQVGVDCYAYMLDLALIVMTQTQGADPSVVAQQNLAIYNAQITQQLAIWSDALIAGDVYKAGATQAYIFQIIFGIQKPALLPKPVAAANATVPLNLTKLIDEFIQSYYKNIGITDQKTVQSSIKCVNQLVTAGPAVIGGAAALSQLSTVEEQLLGSIEVYNQAIDLLTPCATANADLAKTQAALMQAFQAAPVFFVAQVLHNTALNAPQVQQLQQQFNVDIQTGKYTHAGEVVAQLYKIFYKGIAK